MLKIYAIIAAAVTLLLDIPFEVFRQPYSWWLVPCILIGSFIALIIIHIAVLVLSVLAVDLNKTPRDTDFFRMLVDVFLKMAFPLLRVKVHTTGLEKIPTDEPFF